MSNSNPQSPVRVGRFRSFGQNGFGEEKKLIVLRRMLWLYFALLITEGALRKWLFPSLSAPLLVIRDPLVILIYVQAVRCRRFPVNGPMVVYFLLLICFTLLALFQVVAGFGGGPVVAMYGLRTDFLHLPLIFVIPQVFSYMDVVKVGRWMLILSLPMAGLMIWQFLSPPASWINAATIADAQQITFALGKIRPAGTFSFVTGAAHFFVLTTVFLIYGLADSCAPYSRWLLGAALFSVVAVQPVSGSRTLVIGCALVTFAAMVFMIFGWGPSGRILAVAGLICGVFGALWLTTFFREALTVFMTRWDDAGGGNARATLTGRMLGGFLDPFELISEIGFLGQGIGLGTNAASALMTGRVQFLLAEGEWARMIMEAGPLFGFSFLAYRTWLAADMALRAFLAARSHHLLAWLLAWDACRSLLNEQLSQPTNLGFMVLLSGFCLAVMPARRSELADEHVPTSGPRVPHWLRSESPVSR